MLRRGRKKKIPKRIWSREKKNKSFALDKSLDIYRGGVLAHRYTVLDGRISIYLEGCLSFILIRRRKQKRWSTGQIFVYSEWETKPEIAPESYFISTFVRQVSVCFPHPLSRFWPNAGLSPEAIQPLERKRKTVRDLYSFFSRSLISFPKAPRDSLSLPPPFMLFDFVTSTSQDYPFV